MPLLKPSLFLYSAKKNITFADQHKSELMRKKNYFIIFTITAFMTFFSCAKKITDNTVKQEIKTENSDDVTAITEPVVEEAQGTVKASGPAVIVYKTKNDYFDKVPISLSEDKNMIISFPAVSDLYYKGELALPTRLNDGYLLDNRGITKDVAFINITYEAYSRLDMTPPDDLIMQMVLDKDPLIEMYSCGSRNEFQDIVSELNTIIEKKKLKKFKKIK